MRSADHGAGAKLDVELIDVDVERGTIEPATAIATAPYHPARPDANSRLRENPWTRST
jgi:hypothetical protein